jgi:hypothetical protein
MKGCTTMALKRPTWYSRRQAIHLAKARQGSPEPKVIRVNVTKNMISMFVGDAVYDGVWFEVTPLPDGMFEIAVKNEPSPIALALARYAKCHAK